MRSPLGSVGRIACITLYSVYGRFACYEEEDVTRKKKKAVSGACNFCSQLVCPRSLRRNRDFRRRGTKCTVLLKCRQRLMIVTKMLFFFLCRIRIDSTVLGLNYT